MSQINFAELHQRLGDAVLNAFRAAAFRPAPVPPRIRSKEEQRAVMRRLLGPEAGIAIEPDPSLRGPRGGLNREKMRHHLQLSLEMAKQKEKLVARVFPVLPHVEPRPLRGSLCNLAWVSFITEAHALLKGLTLKFVELAKKRDLDAVSAGQQGNFEARILEIIAALDVLIGTAAESSENSSLCIDVKSIFEAHFTKISERRLHRRQ